MHHVCLFSSWHQHIGIQLACCARDPQRLSTTACMWAASPLMFVSRMLAAIKRQPASQPDSSVRFTKVALQEPPLATPSCFVDFHFSSFCIVCIVSPPDFWYNISMNWMLQSTCPVHILASYGGSLHRISARSSLFMYGRNIQR